jgi:integrase
MPFRSFHALRLVLKADHSRGVSTIKLLGQNLMDEGCSSPCRFLGAERCRPDDYVFVSPKKKGTSLRETKRGFGTACRLAGIDGLIWKGLRATFGTRLAEAGCDAFTIAQLLGHSDVRVTMRYVRTVEESKRAAVNAVQLNSKKFVHVLATSAKQPPVTAAVSA